MLASRSVSLLLLSALLALPLTTACSGGGGHGPKVAKVTPGDMPAQGEWTGVYYDQFFGNLHLVREGDMVGGKWRKDNGDSWGELEGTTDGNLLRYEWKEHKIGLVGPSALTKGKGYFVYKAAPVERDPDFIEGERGMNEDEIGQKWKAIKQANVVPDPNSVMPDEIENRGVGGGWDEGEGAGGGDKPGKGFETGAESGGDSGGEKPSTDDGDTDY